MLRLINNKNNNGVLPALWVTCFYSIVCLAPIVLCGCPEEQQKCPEIFEVAEYTPPKMVPTEARRYPLIRVNIDWKENWPTFLLTFNIKPYKSNIYPTFYIGGDYAVNGAGLKVQRILPYDDGYTLGYTTQNIDDGGLLEIKALRLSPSGEITSSGFPACFPKNGRTVIYRQWIHLYMNPFPEEGLYVVTYEHPWEKIKGGNMLFESEKLLIAKCSQQREQKIYASLRDDPLLELMSYKIKHPPISEDTEHRPSEPVRFFYNGSVKNVSHFLL